MKDLIFPHWNSWGAGGAVEGDKTGKPMIVVLIAGKPLAMPWVKENADAVLVQWYAGEQQDVHWQIFCLER